MKLIINFLLVLFNCVSIAQDDNSDGVYENRLILCNTDFNGDGIINSGDNILSSNIEYFTKHFSSLQYSLDFTLSWFSPPGAFANCWDGICGYFDSDTLLDIAGYTFSPAKFYIWEQSPLNPDSFYLVQEFIKAEGGSFGPIVSGDTDGDGKTELIAADVLGICRVYIYENNGNNNYQDMNTQFSIVHTSNSQGGQGIYTGDMNKNGKKEIIVIRGSSSPGGGEVRIWEHSGVIGSNTYTSIYSYTTVTYLFGKGGFGDSDGDGWDEAFLSYGGLPTFNTNIRKIEYDSASSSFQHQMFSAPIIGLPASYKVADVNNDGIKELISTNSSNYFAACYILKSSGQNQYIKLDSIFEYSDPNTMLISDIKTLTGNTYPSILAGSFGGKIYVYQFNGTVYYKEYENTNLPLGRIRRVYWLPVSSYDGYFNTWDSSNTNGRFYVYKRNPIVGISPKEHIAEGYYLYQNYPNPFNPITKIKFDLPNKGLQSLVQLKVYDLLGCEITTLVNAYFNPGTYVTEFNGTKYPSGVYFYKLITDDFQSTKKFIIIK
jgi:hypothetical protein